MGNEKRGERERVGTYRKKVKQVETLHLYNKEYPRASKRRKKQHTYQCWTDLNAPFLGWYFRRGEARVIMRVKGSLVFNRPPLRELFEACRQCGFRLRSAHCSSGGTAVSSSLSLERNPPLLDCFAPSRPRPLLLVPELVCVASDSKRRR